MGERVNVAGEPGEFMVVEVDQRRHTADLIRMTGIRKVESGVPLFALRRIEELEAAAD